MAVLVDAISNELGISIPVAVEIHADHYGIRDQKEPYLRLRLKSLPSSTKA